MSNISKEVGEVRSFKNREKNDWRGTEVGLTWRKTQVYIYFKWEKKIGVQ